MEKVPYHSLYFARSGELFPQPNFNLVLVAAMQRGTPEQKTVADEALLKLASGDAHVSATLAQKLKSATSKDAQATSENNGGKAVWVS